MYMLVVTPAMDILDGDYSTSRNYLEHRKNK